MKPNQLQSEEMPRILLAPLILHLETTACRFQYANYINQFTTVIEEDYSISISFETKGDVSFTIIGQIVKSLGDEIASYVDEYAESRKPKNRQLLLVYFKITAGLITHHINQAFTFGDSFDTKQFIFPASKSDGLERDERIVKSCLSYAAHMIASFQNLSWDFRRFNNNQIRLIEHWLVPSVESGDLLRTAMDALSYPKIFTVDNLPTIFVDDKKTMFIPIPGNLSASYSKFIYPINSKPFIFGRIAVATMALLHDNIGLPSDYLTIRWCMNDLHLALDEKCDVIDLTYLHKIVIDFCSFERVSTCVICEYEGERGIHLYMRRLPYFQKLGRRGFAGGEVND